MHDALLQELFALSLHPADAGTQTQLRSKHLNIHIRPHRIRTVKLSINLPDQILSLITLITQRPTEYQNFVENVTKPS